MDSGHTRIVLRAFWQLYRTLSIYNLDNFRNPRAILSNACKAIVLTVLIASMVIAWISELIHCIQHSFRLSEIALQLAMMINLTSITITYAAIGMKRQSVGGAMDRVRATIDRSEARSHRIEAILQFIKQNPTKLLTS